MKEDDRFWLSLCSVVTTGIVIVTITSLIYVNSKNEKILKADSCVKAVLIDGDGYGRALPLCGLIKE